MSFKSSTRVSSEKKYRKEFARSTACRRYLTRLSRKKDGAGASGSSSSITTNFRVSLGSRNRFFRCLWTKQRIFCGLAIIFSWTRGTSSPFSHLSRSVTRSGSSVTRGLFSAWSSSRHVRRTTTQGRRSTETDELRKQDTASAGERDRSPHPKSLYLQSTDACTASFFLSYSNVLVLGQMPSEEIFVSCLSARCVCGSAILCYHDCCHRISLTCAHWSSRALTTPFCQVAASKQP